MSDQPGVMSVNALRKKQRASLLDPPWLWIAVFFLLLLFLLAILFPGSLWAQDIAQVKKGVVKITAQVEGKHRVGSGIIVKLEDDHASIVTASHVVEGDAQPQVVFFTKPTRSFPGRVLGLDGGNPRGLAVLLVEGDLPSNLQVLPLNPDFEVTGGEPATVIGFPRVPAVPWAVTPGAMTGQEGQNLIFSGAAVEGNSGGPIMVGGKVVGVVTEVNGQYGYAVPVPIVRVALRGWGITLGLASKETALAVPKTQLPEGAKGQLPREITGKDGAPMVLIPAGEFWMGSPDGEGDKDEHPRHRVFLDGFNLDKYEVTNRRFEQFVGETNYRTTAERDGKAYTLTPAHKWEEVSGAHWRKPEGGDTVFVSNREEHPVVSVSWNDAEAYCRWAGKRLPTEAEFEYATRAGTETKYWWGDGIPGSRRVGNVADESLKRQYSSWTIMTAGYDDGYVRTAPVGSYEVNRFGLHDMTGNAWEWVADWYDESYYGQKVSRNPSGPPKGEYKVLRGGSWFHQPDFVRSAYRTGDSPSTRIDGIGFRCARDAQQ